MKRRYFALCLVIELVILFLFRSHLSDVLPMQLNMFTESVVMSMTYANSILLPAALFLIAIHVVAIGLGSVVPVMQAKTSPVAHLGASLLPVLSGYLEIFSVVLMFYCFDLPVKGLLLSMASFSLLAVVLAVIIQWYRSNRV